MKTLAFAVTEYQQNILLTICLQASLRFDVLFVRANIALNESLAAMAGKVVRLSDIPYSWRNARQFADEFKSKVEPEIAANTPCRVFSHSIEHPFIRLSVAHAPTSEVHLFEEGTGSYVRWGHFFTGLGPRAALGSMLVSFLVGLHAIRFAWVRRSLKGGWALYPGCFPDENLELELIDHGCFRRAMQTGLPPNDPGISIPEGSVIFIQQPYVEMGILEDEEYIGVHVEAIKKIVEQCQVSPSKLFWKNHPRTNRSKELRRLKEIYRMTGVEIEILDFPENVEQMTLKIGKSVTTYFSIGSSSLYVIKTLTEGMAETICISSPLLEQRLPSQVQLLSLFRRVGVVVV